ncbi:MAG TPA: hypothetical protein VND91_03580, partial [Candidatus Saccharimonadia bacterium]|nr:hypothetical protein [Candidatus Saccharimonadia bacterium]
MNAPSRKMRTLAVAAVALVVVLALSAALLAFQAKSAVARIVEVLRPGYEITYVSPRVGLNGDLSVRELKVRPVGDDRATLTAVRAELRPSGPAWFLRAAFESGAALPPIEKLSLKLEGVAIEGSGDLHPSLRWIGTRSAAPFEGAGCSASIHFSAEDWEQLELGSGPASIDAEYAVTGPGLGTVTAAYAVPGSSRIEHRRVLKLEKPFEPLPLDPARAATVESQWAVIDEGFVTARNRLCARRARVARNHFADVHATAVRDWLRRLELEPSAGLIETYRRYALGGGELRWQSRPRAPIVFASYAAARADERVRVLAATLAATGKPAVAFELARVTPTVDPLDPAAALAGGDSAASPALADAGGAPASASAPGVDASASTEPTTPGTITAPTITPPPIAAPADPKPAVASAPAP